VWYFGRKSFRIEEELGEFTKPQLRREFYAVAFAVSLAQFIAGPLVLFTLPAQGLHFTVVGVVLLGACNAVPAVWLIWRELVAPETSGKLLPYIAVLLTVTVLSMAFGRHMYREMALEEHRRDMAVVTTQWLTDSAQAAYDLKTGNVRSTGKATPGQMLFEANCSACHDIKTKLIGPPLTEIAKIYPGAPELIVKWATAPGKKRPDYPQMPAFATLGEAKLREIANYVLQAGKVK
jgi:cytochrome c